jgi:cobalt/nickel transport system permease protein
MIFESFCNGNSLLHRLDARIKITGVMSFTMIISLSKCIYTGLTGIFIGVLLIILSRLEPGKVLWRVLIVNGFVVFLWFTLPLTYYGDFFRFGPFKIYNQGLLLAALITVKTNAIILFFITLLATSSIVELGRGLERLLVPNKFCLLLLFSYRYIFVISQEYQKLARAAKLRCFKPGNNKHTYQTYGYLFGMTLVKSWNRAERVRQAMMLRGFQGRFYTLEEKTLGRNEFFFFTGIIISMIVLVFIEFSL